MEIFNKLWLYIGQNSSQLQVFLGAIAIIIGFTAAWFAKNQIVIAKQQRQDSLDLAKFDLQLKLLEKAYVCENEIEAFKQRYQKEFLEKLNNAQSQNFVQLDSKVSEDENLTLREVFNLPFELLKSSENAISEIINKLTSDQDAEWSKDELEFILKTLIKISSDIRKSTHGITTKATMLEEQLNNIRNN